MHTQKVILALALLGVSGCSFPDGKYTEQKDTTSTGIVINKQVIENYPFGELHPIKSMIWGQRHQIAIKREHDTLYVDNAQAYDSVALGMPVSITEHTAFTVYTKEGNILRKQLSEYTTHIEKR